MMNKKIKLATFGAGCFWHVEEAFRKIKGVVNTIVGYCTDKTGHTEVVQVEYDPSKVSYDELLNLFWKIHDPTQLNRQGPDIGTQYRSAIFYHNEKQKKSAIVSKEKLEKSSKYNKPIVTEIKPVSEFYKAEESHQRYLEKRGLKVCY